MGNDLLQWCRHILYILLDTRQGIGTQICRLDSVSPHGVLLFGADTEPEWIVLLYVITFDFSIR